MKIKMDINRWRTAADISIIECEPMYAGSMYVHKLFIEANLYDGEVLQAEFKVGGESVAQVSLLYKEAVDEQCALYEALIPSKLFITSAPKQVDIVVGLFKLNNGVLNSILVAQPQSFTIEGDGHVFENSMDEEERELYNENLIHLTGRINEFNDIVKNNEKIVAENEEFVSNIREKVSNFKVGDVTVQASESGAEPQVEAEIVDSDEPNEFRLNMDFTLPRGEIGKAAGFGEITANATGLSADSDPTVEVEATGSNDAKNLAFQFGIPKGKAAGFGEISADTDTMPYGNNANVTITPSGTDEAKNLHFQFEIPEGKTGATPDITVTATVDNSVGTPSVEVSQGGTPEAPEINLAFHNMKGEKGEVVGAVASVNGEIGNVEITPEKIGAAAESGIYANLVAGKLQGIPIQSGTDLNDLMPSANKRFEIYVCEGAALSNELLNTPVANMNVTFYMQVIKTWSGGNQYYRVVQTLYTTNGAVYNRSIDYTTGNTPNWGSWKKTTDCLPLAGGTITGNLQVDAHNIYPTVNNQGQLGLSDKKWYAMHATTFHGALDGNASTATELATARTIDGISFDGSADITHYGTCSTGSGTAAKVAKVNSAFTLSTGARVVIKFTYPNITDALTTLNVNNTGAKDIRNAHSTLYPPRWNSGALCEFVYDGTYWRMISEGNFYAKQIADITSMSTGEKSISTNGLSGARLVLFVAKRSGYGDNLVLLMPYEIFKTFNTETNRAAIQINSSSYISFYYKSDSAIQLVNQNNVTELFVYRII